MGSTTKVGDLSRVEYMQETLSEVDIEFEINGEKYCKGPFDPLLIDEINNYTTCSAFESNNQDDVKEALRMRKSNLVSDSELDNNKNEIQCIQVTDNVENSKNPPSPVAFVEETSKNPQKAIEEKPKSPH